MLSNQIYKMIITAMIKHTYYVLNEIIRLGVKFYNIEQVQVIVLILAKVTLILIICWWALLKKVLCYFYFGIRTVYWNHVINANTSVYLVLVEALTNCMHQRSPEWLLNLRWCIVLIIINNLLVKHI